MYDEVNCIILCKCYFTAVNCMVLCNVISYLHVCVDIISQMYGVK